MEGRNRRKPSLSSSSRRSSDAGSEEELHLGDLLEHMKDFVISNTSTKYATAEDVLIDIVVKDPWKYDMYDEINIDRLEKVWKFFKPSEEKMDAERVLSKKPVQKK